MSTTKNMKTTLEKTKGYEIGKNSGKTWLAQITEDGREFIEPSDIDYGDDRLWFRRTRATRFDTYEIKKCGMYLVCELGEQHYRMVFTKGDGTQGWMKLTDERAEKMISMIREGKSFDEARIESK